MILQVLQQVVEAYSMALVCNRESNCTGRRKFSWSSNCSGSGVASRGRRLPCLYAWSECDRGILSCVCGALS